MAKYCIEIGSMKMRDFELWIYHSRMQIIELKMRLNIQFECYAYDMQWHVYNVFPINWWHQTYTIFCCPPRSTQSLGCFSFFFIVGNSVQMNGLFQMLPNSIERSKELCYSHFIWVTANCRHKCHYPEKHVRTIPKNIQHNIVNTVLFHKNWFKIIIIFCLNISLYDYYFTDG